MNVGVNLEQSAFLFPDRPAVSEGRVQLTYAQLNDRVNRVATALIEMGIHPGDHIAITYPNSIDWITCYFGVLKIGAVAVTLAAAFSGDELRNLIAHARPRIVFSDATKLADLEALKKEGKIEKIACTGGDIDIRELIKIGSPSFKAVERDRTDTAVILYTGGTTGVPKGVMITHEHVIFSSQSIAYYEHSNQYDRALCFLPFNHVFGQFHIMNSTIFSAGCVEMLPTLDVDRILKLFEEDRITKFFSVPTVYVRLLTITDLKEKLGKLRYCFSAGASMAMEIVKQWKEVTGITIAESYGMTEGMPITFNHFHPEKHVIGSVGQPVNLVEVQIRDASGTMLEQGKEGEICIRGRNVMKGYLDNPEATSAAFWDGGWLRTGDIGVMDEDGYVYIVDRLKDLIITGGENVSPREVEELLYTRPEVQECAVIGLPDKEWGERVTAIIVPKAGCDIASDEVKLFLKTRLSPFKVPKEYIVVSELPKSAAGKILKREIRRQFAEK
ncbi:MAG: AMP-binding protein [Syntrophus sp. (in: bacteria)]|nr:AMP-binding protein [Syntrophus sp. (in: bacteria)]